MVRERDENEKRFAWKILDLILIEWSFKPWIHIQ